MKIFNSIENLIGGTPLLRLHGFEKAHGISACILAKLEFLNPTGSIKDRAALGMIKDAEEKGIITEGATLIEPTSGNTGIGIAAIGATKGYRVIITMPDTMSEERIKMIRGYGAEVVLTSGAEGMAGAIAKAEELNAKTENSMIVGQFVNPANPKAHFETTGPEIWNDTDGKVDILISAAGTGGTVSGIGAFLKKMNPNVKIVAVEPTESPVLSGGKAGPHKIQGIGAGFIPDTLDTSVIDEIITVSSEYAYKFGAEISKTDGILVGISSGAALAAAEKIANNPSNFGKNIVVILPDSGSRYLSTQNYF